MWTTKSESNCEPMQETQAGVWSKAGQRETRSHDRMAGQTETAAETPARHGKPHSGRSDRMKHRMVCTSNAEYEDGASHCRVCGYVRTGDEALCSMPVDENCPDQTISDEAAQRK